MENNEIIEKLSKDIKKASAILNKSEAKYLTDTYYQIQDFRIATSNQARKLGKEEGEPCEVIKHFIKQFDTLETQIKNTLNTYVKNQKVGRWLLSICGIGPVIAAGLLANIDIEKAPTAGHIQAFGGLDPNREWLGRERAEKIVNDILGQRKEITDDVLLQLSEITKWNYDYIVKNCTSESGKRTKEMLIKALSFRPFNAKLKTLYWKIGQSFVKVSSNDNDIYGKIYKIRKAYEQAKNEAGNYADQAALKKVGKDTEAYKYYSIGQLPPAHIQQRCERYATKIFLSHLHYVMYLDHYGVEPPKPYAISILGHAHEVPVPNLEYLK